MHQRSTVSLQRCKRPAIMGGLLGLLQYFNYYPLDSMTCVTNGSSLMLPIVQPH